MSCWFPHSFINYKAIVWDNTCTAHVEYYDLIKWCWMTLPAVKALVVLDVKWNHKSKGLGTIMNNNKVMTKKEKGNLTKT